MTKTLGRAALATAAILLVPASALIPGVATEAQAGTRVSGQVIVNPSPNLVVGFSFGDPYLYSHVHYRPGHCSAGPIYYYPAYDVYSHYIPQYRYGRYSEPFRHSYRHKIHSRSGYRARDWSDDDRGRGHRHSNGRGHGRGRGRGHDYHD